MLCIAFKYAKRGGILGFFGRLRLGALTDLPLKFYHAEFIFSDGMRATADNWGVRWVKAPINSKDFLVVALRATPDEERAVREWAEMLVSAGTGYDWWALASFVFPWRHRLDDPSGYMCSEFVASGLQILGWLPGENAVDLDPQSLFTAIGPYVWADPLAVTAYYELGKPVVGSVGRAVYEFVRDRKEKDGESQSEG